MARLSKDVVVTSKPVRTFPNGDYLFVELTRTNGYYDCIVKMAQAGDAEETVLVAHGKGKTIREAEAHCYERAIRRCPRFPRPPYLQRGTGIRRVLAGDPAGGMVSRYLPAAPKRP
jgi:hypothetical protein